MSGVELVAAILTAILLLTLTAVVLYEIAGREFTKGGAAPWTAEIANYLFVALAFVASSTSIARDTQPRVRFIVERLSEPVRRPIVLVAEAVTLGLYTYLFYYGIELARLQWPQHGATIGISLGVAALPIPVGAAFMFVSRLRRMSWRSPYGVAGAAVTVVVFWYAAEQMTGTVVTGAFYPLVIGLVLFMFCASVPVAEALLLSALVVYKLTDAFASDVQFSQQLFQGLNTFTYVSIPLFLLAGAIIAGTRMSEWIVAFVREVLGWLPGSLGVVDVAASAVFADLSGSAVSDTVAVGTVMLPQMKEDGYPMPFAVALQGTAGTLGVLFPPAISALLFASVANVSVSYMFAATLVPGILVAVSLMIYVMIVASRRGYGSRTPFSPRRTARTGAVAAPSLGVIVIILGGVLTGTFTSVEAGAVAALYSALLGIVELSRGRFARAREVVAEAAETVGRVCFVIAAALTFGWLMVANYGPQNLVAHLGGLTTHKIWLLLLIMVIMLAVHTLLDVSATILVVVPILTPLLMEAKINLIHFGVLLDLNSTIGLVLPPLGFCLYLVAGVGNVKLEHAARAVIPFVGILAADMLLVLFVPALTTVLPELLGLHQ